MRRVLIALMVILMSASCVGALSPVPKIELDETEIVSYSIDSVYVVGSVTLAKGQKVVLRQGKLPVASATADSGKFKIKVPKAYLKKGANTFAVKSMKVVGKINASSSKGVTITIKDKETQRITANDVTLTVGETKSLGASASSNLKLSYKSSNTGIATVDSGKVTAKKAGSCKITISQEGNERYASASKIINVTVKQAPKKAQTITPLKWGKALPSQPRRQVDSHFRSSDAKIATVDSKGRINGKAQGITTVIVTQNGNSEYNKASKTVKIKVNKKPQVITAQNKNVQVGGSLNLNAKSSGNLKLAYKSRDSKIASVDQSGNVKGIAEGTVYIAISQGGNGIWKSASKNVKITVSKKSQTITASDKNLTVNQKVLLGAKSSSGLRLTYKSSNTQVAVVDSGGNVKGVSSGVSDITISQSGNGAYKAASKTVKIMVGKANQVITTSFDYYTFNKAGYSLQSNGKSPAGNIKYASSNTRVATVNSKGEIVGRGEGTCYITVSSTGNAKYKPASKRLTVKVPKVRDRRSALTPWYDAMETQRIYSYNAKYRWHPNSGPTIATSKTYGTCITYPSVSAMRVGLIEEGRYITGSDGDGGDLIYASERAIKSINRRYWTLYKYPSGTVKELVGSGKILPGDILGSATHTFVYAGKGSDGTLLYNHAGHAAGIYNDNQEGSNRAVKFSSSKSNSNSKLYLIARINTFHVYDSCKNGAITMTNQYMAGQNVKVNYKAYPGKTLKEVRVDGKNVDIRKYPSSYTFKGIDRNHTVFVRFD